MSSLTAKEMKQKVYEAVDRHMEGDNCPRQGLSPNHWCVACVTAVSLVFGEGEVCPTEEVS